MVDIESTDDGSVVVTQSGLRLFADRVVAGIGIKPSTALAESIGLMVDNGIVVDEYLRTDRADIFAAGDVANYPDAILGGRRRVEHADAARAMGRTAGRNMAGAAEPYRYLPMFYSDLFELGYEAVGRLDNRMTLVEDWQDEYRHGVIYYLDDDRVRGVLLFDVWDKVDEARAIIEAGEQVDPASLIGRIR
ncbi:MAG: FAD-dependent oxidoreductase [Candidatus Promineofilum sp.]|nr:FAD-dependent oxidoreductase [Promineifilum sp.]